MTQPTLFKDLDYLQSVPALSLLQPWGEAIFHTWKKIETRSWKTKYRGPLLIHASAKKSKEGREKWKAVGGNIKPARDFEDLYFGKILGIVNLVDCKPIEPVYDRLKAANNLEEIMWGDYSDGRYAWTLENPIRFKPGVAYSGALSIWDAVKNRGEDWDLLSLEYAIRNNQDPRAGVLYKSTADRLQYNYETLRKHNKKAIL